MPRLSAKSSLALLLCLTGPTSCGQNYGDYGYGGGSDRGKSSTSEFDTSPTAAIEDVMVSVSFSLDDFPTDGTFQIDAYEASISNGRAVSSKDVLPAVNINYADAAAACEASGKRICTYNEWVTACKGQNDLNFGFADVSDDVESNCYAGKTELADSDESLPTTTGSMSNCKTKGLDAFDLIGNASEWTLDSSTRISIAAGVAFYFPADNTSCLNRINDMGQDTIDADTESNDVGFRCCL